MDESGAPDEAANGHEQAPPGESPCPRGSRTSGMADHGQVGIFSVFGWGRDVISVWSYSSGRPTGEQPRGEAPTQRLRRQRRRAAG